MKRARTARDVPREVPFKFELSSKIITTFLPFQIRVYPQGLLETEKKQVDTALPTLFSPSVLNQNRNFVCLVLPWARFF